MDFEPATLTEIEASVYYGDLEKDKYFVKIAFIGLGIFANSFSVQPSKFEGQPYWVQPPKHRQGRGWAATIDFDKSYPLWGTIERKAIEAVEQYKRDAIQHSSGTQDVVLEDIPDGPINFDDIPDFN